MGRINKQWRYLKSVIDKSEYSTPYPPTVGIETTAVCNLTCNKCPVGRERKVAPEHAFMDMGLYCKIIDELAGNVEEVGLSLFGEPLINPRFFEYVAYAKEKGLKVVFFSNGIALSDAAINNIVKHRVDSIVFSVDCLPEQYEFYAHLKNVPPHMARRQLEDVIGNIEKLLLKLREDNGATAVSVLRMDAPESTPLLEYTKFWQERGVKTGSGGVLDWGGKIDRVDVTALKKDSISCTQPYAMAIFSSGIVPLCCIDFNADYPLGNVKTQTFKEIFNGSAVRNIRNKLARCDYKGLPCERCRYESYDFPASYFNIMRTIFFTCIYNDSAILKKIGGAVRRAIARLK